MPKTVEQTQLFHDGCCHLVCATAKLNLQPTWKTLVVQMAISRNQACDQSAPAYGFTQLGLLGRPRNMRSSPYWS